MGTPHIDTYQFGKIVIDGQEHTKDVILLPDRVIGGWWRQESHVLRLSDLEEVLIVDLQELVIGKGAFNRIRITSDVEEALSDIGIELIALPTKEACQEYNRRSQARKVAAALHLTC
jgi:hypothetical protein